MTTDYEDNQVIFDLSEHNYSSEEVFSRKKKSKKRTEKKSRRSGDCFGRNRGCPDSMEIRARKKKRKINYESKLKYIYSHENILEDEVIESFCVDIPEELFIKILSRLPIKTLARFKCVSKLWRNLISNDVPVTNTPKLLVFSHSQNGEISFYSLENEACVKSLCSPVKKHLLHGHMVKGHSSCHGLLLIQINKDLFIWNPLTKFLRKVLSIEGFTYSNDKCWYEVDLCYCSDNEEYKVVSVVKSCSNYLITQNFYVATCGARNWEKIENINLEEVTKGPFVKGYRHWSCSYENKIVYFDPSTYKFIEVAMPKREEGVENNFTSLGVFDGCLCITRLGRPEFYKNLEFLVMKEYGNGSSWEVMFACSTKFNYFGMKHLLRTKEGEVLVGMCPGWSCYYAVKAYDVHGNFLRHIWDDSISFGVGDFEVILYEESWCSPTNMKTLYFNKKSLRSRDGWLRC